ncbi:class I glutamine amidotransferase-like protein [Lasiosphaeria ovina]|uniref:glutaminase n=1 Tax=Lasiosphaeria ovina TaxID=92902 RepID=A0AAE0ND25_9PEZI|nr:class I glutamine amidotransferase-like protein [Lasiosphaeria ovina]
MTNITVGVLALQGGVIEHLSLLRKAAASLPTPPADDVKPIRFSFIEVRTTEQLAQCDALIIPGGESTTMAIVARRLGLLEPLRQFVKIDCKPVWGTCAGLVMLAEEASATKQGGQELVGGLDVRVLRNRYGTQIQSFVADLNLPFLGGDAGHAADVVPPFRGIFIRAPVVEEIMTPSSRSTPGTGDDGKELVEVLGVFRKPGSGIYTAESSSTESQKVDEDIVAVRQRNVFGTSFHPELTNDTRIHAWWLKYVVDAARQRNPSVPNSV